MAALMMTSLLWGAPRAYAADLDRIISDDLHYHVTQSGTIKVREEIKFLFARSMPSQGVDIRIRTVAPWPEDPERVRVVKVGGARAKTGEGEPISVATRHEGRDAVITLGSSQEVFSAPTMRSYIVEYELKQALTVQGDLAELTWPVRPGDAALAADRITVTMVGPSAAQETSCVRTQGECNVEEGVSLRYTANSLASAEGLTVGAAWPRSAFLGPLLPNLDDADSPSSIMTFAKDPLSSRTAATVALSQAALGVLLPLLALLIGLRNRRRFRPERFAQTAPGVVAPAGSPIEVGRLHGPFSTRREPPEVDPLLTGLLLDGVVDPIDVSSLVVSLADKGLITLRLSGTEHHVALHPNPAAAVTEHEKTLLTALRKDLSGKPEIKLADATALNKEASLVPTDALCEARRLGLIRPGFHRLDWLGWVIPLALLVLLAALFNALSSGPIDQYAPLDFPIPSLAVFLIGVAVALALMLSLRRGREFRTPKGVALTEQAIGFRHFLSTAKASDLPADEATDVFSAYLPYALVLGVSDHWLRAFTEARQQAEAAGVRLDLPGWMKTGGDDWAGFGTSLRTLGAEVTGMTDVDSNTATGWAEADRRSTR